MPRTASVTTFLGETDASIRQLHRSLRRLGASRAVRLAIAEDVRGDLNAAAAEGVQPAALLGSDIDAFARQALEAGGHQPTPKDYQRVLIICTVAAAVGIPALYLLLSYLVHPLFVDWFELDGSYPTAGPVVAYAFMVLTGTGLIITTLYAALAARPARRETITRAALLTPLGGVLSVVAVLAVMDRPGFALSEASIYTQVLPAGAIPVLIAIATARWWARRAAASTSTIGNDWAPIERN